MVVNSFSFWLFFACVLIPYYGLFRKSIGWQNLTLLIASYVFYGMVDWRMSLLLLGVTAVFYYLGTAIAKNKKVSPKRSAVLLTLAVCLGAGLLLYFKYLNFFIEQFSALFNTLGLKTNWNTFKIVMPLGISFFTFKLIAYVIEIYRGHMKPSKDPVAFGTYIAFFPTIISGPIDSPLSFIDQLNKRRSVNYQMLTEATRRILWGMFLKMCIADNLSEYTTTVLSGYSDFNATTIVLASVLYSFQIYTDFAGYTEMAIGVSSILGIRVMENFNRPYLAASVTEFWKRWHISLTKWLTQYIYISLGGNRCTKIKQYWNVMVTFLVSGLWHGANWTFIVWGGLHGIYQIIEKALGLNKYLKQSSSTEKGGARLKYLRVFVTFLLVTVNWVLFQSDSFSMFKGTMLSLGNGIGLPFIPNIRVLAPAIMFIVILMVKEIINEHGYNIHFLHSEKRWLYLSTCFILCLTILVFGNLGANDFIYFQF